MTKAAATKQKNVTGRSFSVFRDCLCGVWVMSAGKTLWVYIANQRKN